MAHGPLLILLLAAAFCSGDERAPRAEAAAPSDAPRILVFSKTAGFRHASIPDAVAAVRLLGSENGFGVDSTEDGSAFTDAGLAPYDAVVFLLTTGDVLDDSQQAAFERYVRSGRGFVGVHSASDTEYGWPFYGELVGAPFAGHPEVQSATVRVVDRVHSATRGLPESWPRVDEWYNFAFNPRAKVHVLATLDETTYSGGAMGTDHPIAWCRFVFGGRAFYTALGHTNESYAEPLFLAHLLGGIQFAAGYPDCARPAVRAPRAVPPR
jgi:type 1 glutamine amidotransferase